MKRIYTTILGISLLFGAAACSGEAKQKEDINKAIIEAAQKAKEELKQKAIKSLNEAKSLEMLKKVYEALPKDILDNTEVKKAMEAKKAELEKKAKDEAEEKKAKALEQAKKFAIEALNEVENLESLKTTFEGFPKEVQEDSKVKELMEAKKAEFEKAAKEKAEAEKAAKWLEGKTFECRRSEDGVSEILTLIFQEQYTFISKNQMEMGGEIVDMNKEIKGTYKYLKPTLKMMYKKADLTGGASYGDVKFIDVTEEYQVDEEKGTITAIIKEVTYVFKLKK